MSKKVKVLFIVFILCCIVGCAVFYSNPPSDLSSDSDHGMMCPEGSVWFDEPPAA